MWCRLIGFWTSHTLANIAIFVLLQKFLVVWSVAWCTVSTEQRKINCHTFSHYKSFNPSPLSDSSLGWKSTSRLQSEIRRWTGGSCFSKFKYSVYSDCHRVQEVSTRIKMGCAESVLKGTAWWARALSKPLGGASGGGSMKCTTIRGRCLLACLCR